MLVKTKYFGEIELDEDKIITFEKGIMGFEEYHNFTILYDIEDEKDVSISWLQSIDEMGIALPIINPFYIKEDYDPVVEDDLLTSLGEMTEDNLAVFVTLTVPADLKKMTANLKAPFIVNTDTKKACQMIAENQDYPVKHYVYEKLHKVREGE